MKKLLVHNRWERAHVLVHLLLDYLVPAKRCMHATVIIASLATDYVKP